MLAANPRIADSRIPVLVCFAALLVGVATWFVAIRSPLWLDETWTYWEICGSAHQTWVRSAATVDPLGYICVLWPWIRIFGASEFALRLPSLLAMGASLGLLYRAARIFLSRQTAILATLLFAVHPVVVFAAIDARPYAFANLATCATLFLLFRYRSSNSAWSAIGLGCAAASMLAFHFLFAAIVPAILASMLLLHEGSRRSLLKKLPFACGAFLLATVALAPSFLRVFHARDAYVFAARPTLLGLLLAIAPFAAICAFAVVLGASVLTGSRLSSVAIDTPANRKWLGASLLLGLFPLLSLFTLSMITPIHLFTPRYYLVALPGCALASAILVQKIFDPSRQTLFCFALACIVGLHSFSPAARHHRYTWKYALAAADANASRDHAPLIVCSDFAEADSTKMPVPSPQTSKLYSQLSYFPVHTTVIPMPRTLNAEAVRTGRLFLSAAAAHHQRFLATGYVSSAGILDWLTSSAAPEYTVRLVGDFDHVRLLEFDPR